MLDNNKYTSRTGLRPTPLELPRAHQQRLRARVARFSGSLNAQCSIRYRPNEGCTKGVNSRVYDRMDIAIIIFSYRWSFYGNCSVLTLTQWQKTSRQTTRDSFSACNWKSETKNNIYGNFYCNAFDCMYVLNYYNANNF